MAHTLNSNEGAQTLGDIGRLAPDFSLPSVNEQGEVSFRLRALRGQWVILYFYPKDNTSGCTAQACDFRDFFSQLRKSGAVVVGVSRDHLKSHLSFQSKHDLPFVLASDEDGSVCQAYGVWVSKSMYGRSYMGIERSTFLIDPKGYVRQAWRKVKVPGHVALVLEELKKLAQ